MVVKYNVIKKIFAFLVIAACAAPTAVATPRTSATKALTEEQKIVHVLNRLGFGARPGDVERVKAMGIKKYIESQLDPGSIPDTVAERRIGHLDALNMSTAELFAKYPNPAALLRQLEGDRRQPDRNGAAAAQNGEEMTRAEQQERRRRLQALYREYGLRPANQLLPQFVSNRVLRAVYSERQLQEVMVDFWQNHFNVFAGKAAVRWYIPSYERDVLRKHALSNFRDLLVGTAQHPAMLFYLDNFESVAPLSDQDRRPAGGGRLQQAIRSGSLTPRMREQIKRRQGLTDAELDQRIERAKANVQRASQRMRRGLNENYARELMELHTMGVDSGYTQQDIVEVARAFTGWTIADPRGYRRAAAGMINGTEDARLDRLQRAAGIPDDVESGEFYFNSRTHDNGPKTVLGQKVDAGGINDGLKVIDILVKHPATAKFIARKLAVKFISDEPSNASIERIATTFTRSNGDIKTTLRAVFSDPEFFAPSSYRAKIKTPFELAISAIRAVNADTNSSPALIAMLNKLGEVPYGYQAPTGYPDTAEDWVNTGALLERLNFAVAVASNRIPDTRADLTHFRAKDKAAVLDVAIGKILNDEISAATRAALVKQLEQPLPEVTAGTEPDEEDPEVSEQPMARGRGNRQARLLPPSGDPDLIKVVSLVLGTPEFQRQ